MVHADPSIDELYIRTVDGGFVEDAGEVGGVWTGAVRVD